MHNGPTTHNTIAGNNRKGNQEPKITKRTAAKIGFFSTIYHEFIA